MTRLLFERYASAKDFLAELTEYHGSNAYLVSPDRTLVMAKCPSCAVVPQRVQDWEVKQGREPGERHWTEFYRILVRKVSQEGPWPGWDYWALCGCSDRFMVTALVRMERDRLDRQVRDLEATAVALEEEASAFVN